MPRQKKYKKRRSYRRRFNIFPFIIAAAIVVAAIFMLWRWTGNFFVGSPLFKVSRIELAMNPCLKEALNVDFYRIPRNVNIFELDIGYIERDTLGRHSEFKLVTVSRRLPNVINVRIEYKDPVVFLKFGSAALPLSYDGIVLPDAVALGRVLPVLSGVGLHDTNKLALGIKFAVLINTSWPIKGHRLDIIDLKDTRNISMYLENGIEVKMGDGSYIKEKLIRLKSIVTEPKFDLKKIQYIDLRFTDVVIGPKQFTPKGGLTKK